MKTIKTYLPVCEFLELGGELNIGDKIYTDEQFGDSLIHKCRRTPKFDENPIIIKEFDPNHGILVNIKEYDKKGKVIKDRDTYYGTGWTFIECEIKLAVEETISK